MAITKAYDTSRHNHPLTGQYPNGVPFDFNLAYADGYRIWMGRAAVGNYYIDGWFAPDFDGHMEAGFICIAYFVSTPEYSDAQQYDKFIQALGGRKPDGIVLDAELSRGQTPTRVTACNQYLADRFKLLCPGRVLLYTNKNFADNYLLSDLGLPLIVANPGPDNGMNYNASPAMPRLWDEFIAWQKDWKHTIPGIPDPTTDYSEFQMSEAEARAYFGVLEQEGDDVTILTKLDEVLANQAIILENQGIIIAALDDAPPAPPPVEPPPADPPADPPAKKYYVKVTAPDRTNARFLYGVNGKGVPIFQIYPSDSSKAYERIQYESGKLLEVLPQKIDGDSNIDCYELVGRMSGDGKQLYAWSQEVMKTW